MAAVCKITNGVDYVSLVGPTFYITDWRQGGVPFKGDGVWQDPVFAEGRRLTDFRIGNISETIVVSQSSASQNIAIEQANKLSRMLLSAAEYSSSPKHGRRPVYLEVKSTQESNTRYAIIHAGWVGEYGNPFSQPFLQHDCSASVADLNIIIERGPWLEVPPGDEVCQAVKPTGNRIGDTTITYNNYADLITLKYPPLITYPPFAFYKLTESSGTTATNYAYTGTALDGAHDATNTLEDIYFWTLEEKSTFIPIVTGNVDIYCSGNFDTYFDGDIGTISLWFNTTGQIWTSGFSAYLVNLQTPSSYLRIFHPSSPDNSLTWEYSPDGSTIYHNESVSYTDRWVHIAMTWNYGLVKAYMDGRLVQQFFLKTHVPWAGSLTSTTTVLGARVNDGTDPIISNMAYAAFWNQALTDDEIELLSEKNNSRPEGVNFDAFDCDEIEAYVSNKSNDTFLNYVYHYDSSLTTYSSNLIDGTPPYGILPSTIGANDAVYFGVQQRASSQLPDGPFDNLALDVTTGASAATSYVTQWQYYNGSTWTALSNVTDRTNAFQTEGINVVSWDQPSNWAAVSINGVSCYWVRLLVTSVSGAWTQPIVSDIPYTINDNAVNIPSNTVGGSMPSLGRITWTNLGSDNTDRVVIGARSKSISPNFRSYICMTDALIGGATITATHGDASFADDMTSPSGRKMDLTYSSGSATVTEIFNVRMRSYSSYSYLGSFKAFMIYTANLAATGANTEFGYRISFTGGTNDYEIIDTGNYILTANGFTVHEIGEINIAPDALYGDRIGNVEFVWRSEIPASTSVDFYALVLIPTDEWFGDFDGVKKAQPIIPTYALSADGIRYSNRSLVSEVRSSNATGAYFIGTLDQSHSGPVTIYHDRESSFHFLFIQDDGTGEYEATLHQLGQVRLYRNRRYNYGRGSE